MLHFHLTIQRDWLMRTAGTRTRDVNQTFCAVICPLKWFIAWATNAKHKFTLYTLKYYIYIKKKCLKMVHFACCKWNPRDSQTQTTASLHVPHYISSPRVPPLLLSVSSSTLLSDPLAPLSPIHYLPYCELKPNQHPLRPFALTRLLETQ